MSAAAHQQFRISGVFLLPVLVGLVTASLRGQTLYDFGNPIGEEQLYIELINRARANPPAEGARLAASSDPEVMRAFSQFSVDLALMQSEFNAIGVQPPLAPNASLNTAARGHSAWMLANAIQSHYQTNPDNTPWDRIVAAGYPYTSSAENAYAYYSSSARGHAGFQVDWGADDLGTSGGMQARRGHRANIHSFKFREIGVGVAIGRNGNVGPQLVTQDFGYRSTAPSFATGVAFYDLNNNDFYDINEGISGLTVNVEGAAHYCKTAIGGGWAIPVPSAATTRTVTFSGLGINQSASLVLPEANNAKADLKLDYTPPAITSSATASEGVSHTIDFTAISGATEYQWNRWAMTPATRENCENASVITATTTGGYSVLNTGVKQQGASSFRLVNTAGIEQFFELNTLYFGQSSPSLSFQSQIRFATPDETFKVQVKEESGTSVWQDVFSQRGTRTVGESNFSLRSAAIAAMENKVFRVRFCIDPGNREHYSETGNLYGWFIDAISFSNVSALSNRATDLLTETSASFIPSSGTTLMSVAPVISNLDFPPSYQMLVAPSSGFTLTSSGANGSIDGSGSYQSMTTATLSATPHPGYIFSGWTGDASGTTNPLTVLMDSDKNIGAVFTLVDSFNLTFIGTPFDLRVGNQANFDLNRILSPGETIKLAGKLPSGLKFNSATGMITGTISGKSGAYKTSIQVLQGKTLQRTIELPITVLDFPPTLIGNFECLLEDSNSVPFGVIKITITGANRWSASLETGGATQKRGAKGSFILAEGAPIAPITATFPATPGAPAFSIDIPIDGSSPSITGTHAGGTLRGLRLAKVGETPPTTVTYSLILDAGEQDGINVPAGHGWMKGKVSNSGAASFKGLLGDGTSASINLRVSASGQAVLWSQPYKNKNSFIGGIVTLGNIGQSSLGEPPLTNSVWWTKAADASTLSYPNGFPGMPISVGTSRWVTPASATALGSSLGWRESRKAEVIIKGAGLYNQDPLAIPASLPTEFTLDDKFDLIPSLPISASLATWKGKVSKTDGAVSGALNLPSGMPDGIASGISAASGLLVQDESLGTVTGCGLIKVPATGLKGSFRTAALVLDQ